MGVFSPLHPVDLGQGVHLLQRCSCESVDPGGCAAFRSHSNRNMLTHPARAQADGGCTTLVPGSHTRDAGPPPGFAGFGTDGASLARVVALHSIAVLAATCLPTRLGRAGAAQEEMPGAVRVVRKAGDALLFDTRSWHTGQNTHDLLRVLIICLVPSVRAGS